jgi:hypothetical protein
MRLLILLFTVILCPQSALAQDVANATVSCKGFDIQREPIIDIPRTFVVNNSFVLGDVYLGVKKKKFLQGWGDIVLSGDRKFSTVLEDSFIDTTYLGNYYLSTKLEKSVGISTDVDIPLASIEAEVKSRYGLNWYIKIDSASNHRISYPYGILSNPINLERLKKSLTEQYESSRKKEYYVVLVSSITIGDSLESSVTNESSASGSFTIDYKGNTGKLKVNVINDCSQISKKEGDKINLLYDLTIFEVSTFRKSNDAELILSESGSIINTRPFTSIVDGYTISFKPIFINDYGDEMTIYLEEDMLNRFKESGM